MGNKRKQKRHKLHKRLLRGALVTTALAGLGVYMHHEVVMLFAGSAAAAVFDVIFMEVF